MVESNSPTRIENYSDKKRKPSLVIKITGGAIFAALSLAIAVLAKPLVDSLRTPWGLAWWDPVSVIWILSFFIFGYEAGILTSVIGMLLLFVTDPYAGILGPLFKFFATIPLIAVPFFITKIRKQQPNNENTLHLKNLIVNWVFGVLVRLILMIGLNFFAIFVFFGGAAFFDFVSLEFLGLDSVNGWFAFVLYVIFFNFLQSISDYLIPYALIKPLQVGIPNLIVW